jgi:hypothetical protein
MVGFAARDREGYDIRLRSKRMEHKLIFIGF